MSVSELLSVVESLGAVSLDEVPAAAKVLVSDTVLSNSTMDQRTSQKPQWTYYI